MSRTPHIVTLYVLILADVEIELEADVQSRYESSPDELLLILVVTI